MIRTLAFHVLYHLRDTTCGKQCCYLVLSQLDMWFSRDKPKFKCDKYMHIKANILTALYIPRFSYAQKHTTETNHNWIHGYLDICKTVKWSIWAYTTPIPISNYKDFVLTFLQHCEHTGLKRGKNIKVKTFTFLGLSVPTVYNDLPDDRTSVRWFPYFQTLLVYSCS